MLKKIKVNNMVLILSIALILVSTILVFFIQIGFRGGKRYRLLSEEIMRFNDFLSTDPIMVKYINDNVESNEVVGKLMENYNIMLHTLKQIDTKI